MNDSTDKHEPTDDFVEYLARDTMRRLRHEARFGPPPSELRTRSQRLTPSFGIAAGVMVTLTAGMVLGASANYASAEVLPNGTTTIPSRPTLAILPIKNALTAIGCTQSPPHAAATTTPTIPATPSTSTTPTAPATVATNADSVIDADVVLPARAYPDRAMIAAYARQHQPSVVRGDTAAEYIVMALDASNNYVWSTHGTGNFSIEVGADTRTPTERREYARVHHAEFFGKTSPFNSDFTFRNVDSAGRRIGNVRDSLGGGSRTYWYTATPDSLLRTRLGASRVARDSGGLGDIARLGFVRARVDSIPQVVKFSERTEYKQRDSANLRDYADGYFATPILSNAPCAMGAAGRGVRGGGSASDSLPRGPARSYTKGWMESVRGSQRPCNQAVGLRERGGGESGIVGLASANVSAADYFYFSAGELGQHALKIMVVRLTPGTTWNGR